MPRRQPPAARGHVAAGGLQRQDGQAGDRGHRLRAPIRGLPPADGVTYRVIDAGHLRRLSWRRSSARSTRTPYVAAEDAAFTRLGLIEPDDDLGELILDALRQTRCWPTTTRGRTRSRSSARLDKIGDLESVVVAHEYGHALQDAAYDLEARRIRRPRPLRRHPRPAGSRRGRCHRDHVRLGGPRAQAGRPAGRVRRARSRSRTARRCERCRSCCAGSWSSPTSTASPS